MLVLSFENGPSVVRVLLEAAAEMGAEIVVCSTPREGYRAHTDRRPDVITVGDNVSGVEGRSIIEHLGVLFEDHPPILALVGSLSDMKRREWQRAGAAESLELSVDRSVLIETLRRLVGSK